MFRFGWLIEINEPKKSGIKILKNLKTKDIILPNPEELEPETLYINALSNLPIGPDYATNYHSLIAAIFIRLFVPPLQNPKIEEEIYGGTKRVDIRLTNNSKIGFFNWLKDSIKIPAGYISIECKNYNVEIKNEQTESIKWKIK